MEIQLDDETAVFYCNVCKNDVRIVPGGAVSEIVPTEPCFRCKGFDWIKMNEVEFQYFREDHRVKREDVARVFFCMRKSCRKPFIAWDGKHVENACSCGSKMFEELIGPQKDEYLKNIRELRLARQQGTR